MGTRGILEDPLPDGCDIPSHREVGEGICAVSLCENGFLHLLIRINPEGDVPMFTFTFVESPFPIPTDRFPLRMMTASPWAMEERGLGCPSLQHGQPISSPESVFRGLHVRAGFSYLCQIRILSLHRSRGKGDGTKGQRTGISSLLISLAGTRKGLCTLFKVDTSGYPLSLERTGYHPGEEFPLAKAMLSFLLPQAPPKPF